MLQTERILLSLVIMVCLVHLIRVHTAAQIPVLSPRCRPTVESALKRAGGNRNELARAIALRKGAKRLALCDMISRMPSYDLTHITSGMLVDHVDCAFAVNERVPWRLRTDSNLFLCYVLPHRVSCESLENSRRQLMRITYPLVKSCRDPRVAVERIVVYINTNANVMKGNLGSAWPYDYPALESLNYCTLQLSADCRGRTLRTVAMLRSVGIPARIVDRCAHQWFTATHVALQYYDVQTKQWCIWETAERINGDRMYTEGAEVALYALAPYMPADLLGKGEFDEMPYIGTLGGTSGRLAVTVTSGKTAASNAWVSVYVWNVSLGNWVHVFRQATDRFGRAAFSLGSNVPPHPYMICAGRGPKTTYTFVQVPRGRERAIVMDISQLPDRGEITVQ